MKDYSNIRIGIIGLGSMSTAIVKGLIRHGGVLPENIYASGRNWEKLESKCKALGIHPVTNEDVVKQSEIVIIGVTPKQVVGVLDEIGEFLRGKIIVSIAYGVTGADYEKQLPVGSHVICTVPNTPVEVGKGVFVCADNHSLLPEQLAVFQDIFGRIALIEMLPPNLLNLGGIIAGSTPAFMDMVMEALSDAAVLHGMPRATSYRLVEKMMEGTAAYALESGTHPGILKDGVCSPGGETIKGVRTLESRDFRGALIQAVDEIME